MKIGVTPQRDAHFLFHDFDIQITSTFDLRFLAKLAGSREPGGLKKMCKTYLLIHHYDDEYYFLHFNWEDRKSSEDQIQYASNDVHNAIELFNFFARDLRAKRLFEEQSNYIKRIINGCTKCKYLDSYYEKHVF